MITTGATGRDTVKIVPIGVAHLLKQRVIVSKPANHRCIGFFRSLPAERRKQLIDSGDGAHRRRREIRIEPRSQPGAQHVTVRINENPAAGPYGPSSRSTVPSSADGMTSASEPTAVITPSRTATASA